MRFLWMTRKDTVRKPVSRTPATVARHRRRLTAWLALACVCAGSSVCFALDDDVNPLGIAASVSNKPLQELLHARRPGGPIYLSIPQAFAIVSGGPNGKPACVPQIVAANTSDRTLEMLMVGIHYRQADGRGAGSTLLRFDIVKVGNEKMNDFANPLAADACTGMTGDVEIIRCTYDTGESCRRDVQAVGYGAIPLTLREPK